MAALWLWLPRRNIAPSLPVKLAWGLVLLAVALRGGGPYSIDRLLKREL